jgi:hypothetical protein
MVRVKKKKEAYVQFCLVFVLLVQVLHLYDMTTRPELRLELITGLLG